MKLSFRGDLTILLNSHRQKGDNIVDNVEVVEIKNAEAGATYTITVTHKGTLLGFNNQNYSLIISGVDGLNSATDFENSVFGVYPNPATDVINITLKDAVNYTDCNIVMYDLQGRAVKSFNTFTDVIDVADLTKGVYVLMLDFDNGSHTESKKIIVK